MFNLLADNLVEQFGSGIPDENEDDWGDMCAIADRQAANAPVMEQERLENGQRSVRRIILQQGRASPLSPDAGSDSQALEGRLLHPLLV